MAENELKKKTRNEYYSELRNEFNAYRKERNDPGTPDVTFDFLREKIIELRLISDIRHQDAVALVNLLTESLKRIDLRFKAMEEKENAKET